MLRSGAGWAWWCRHSPMIRSWRSTARGLAAREAMERRRRPPLQGRGLEGCGQFSVPERVRTIGDRTSTERAYYRSHWEVENRLHW